MSTTFDANAVASALLSARAGGSQLQPADISAPPATLADAYAVHRAVIAELGPVGAFKTSKTEDGIQIMAPIPASGVRPSGATFTADELVLAGIELEIAFRVEQPLPPPEAPDFIDRLRRAVVAVPAIEVVDTRLAFHATCDDLTKLADNQFNAGLVVGAPLTDWQELNLTDPDHTFHAGETIISAGAGKVPGGSAFASLAAFVGIVGDHCGGLRPGQYVTTGALSGLHWIDKGRHVSGRIDGLGPVEVVIDG